MPLLQVQYDKDICSVISASTIQVTRKKTLVALGNKVLYREWGTLAWAEATLRIEAKVTAAVKEALDPKGDRYLDIVTRAFDSVFAKDTPLKLKRFSTLQDVLVTEVLRSAVAQAKKAAARTVDKMLKQALMQLDYSSVLGDTFQQLDFGIRGCVIKHIIQQVKMQPLRLPEGFTLTEDAAVNHQRLMLLSKLEKLHTATDKISHIEDALSVNAVQPLSAASTSQPNQIPDAVDYATAQQHGSAPPDTSEAPVPNTAAESTADTAPHSGASQNHASAVGNPPAATGTSAEVQSATAESTLQADSSDEIQMHAIPVPQLSPSTSAVHLDSDNINAQFAAALLQSTWQDAAVGQQAPASSSSAPSSPASTPVPESFPAQAPASAANSPRAVASAPAGTGPAQTSAAQIVADQESSAAAQARPSSPAPSEASYVHL